MNTDTVSTMNEEYNIIEVAREPIDATIEDLENFDLGIIEDPGCKIFRIKDDLCADWAVRKIMAERAEYERLKEIAEQQIAAIEEKLEAAKRRYENGTGFLTNCLEGYFKTVPHKSTKTTEKYRLLSETLTLKKGGTKTQANDEVLVPWLKANGYGDLVKVTESAMWGDLKKKLTFAGGIATLEDTGEIVEGVTVTEAPDTFKIEA